MATKTSPGVVINITPDYLHIEVTARFSIELGCHVVDLSLEHCLLHKENRVFLDVRKMPGKLSIIDRLRVGLYARKLSKHAIKTVLVGTGDQILADSFLENVLVNAGVQARTVTDPEVGKQWLAQFKK